jgi:AcrR family transcriptional regulator
LSTKSADHRRAVAERNLESILDATEALLARNAPLSMSAVAADAGVSRPTLYAHFADRETLLTAVVARAVECCLGSRSRAPFRSTRKASAHGTRVLPSTTATALGARR